MERNVKKLFLLPLIVVLAACGHKAQPPVATDPPASPESGSAPLPIPAPTSTVTIRPTYTPVGKPTLTPTPSKTPTKAPK